MTLALEPVIGLEVHAQLTTRSKLFCGCSTAFGAPPNTHVCPVCVGLPGSLPQPNGGAIELAMRAALALGCTVRARSVFARKNYFYPDLAKNYQISQYELPLNERGWLTIEVEGTTREVGIGRVHLEEDAAKNLHGAGLDAGTLVDFNRAGVPLIEIVSDPDLRSAAEAEEYLKRLREILMFTGVNDGNLEEGSFRCDANVSVRPAGSPKLGTRTELKNINSFRFVRRAIEHEIARQCAVLSGGGTIVQETRHWDETRGVTVAMRSKEEAMDYRYFPDPDLPPLVIEDARVARVRAALPELPVARRARWQAELGLTAADAAVLTSHPVLADWFEAAAAALVAAGADGGDARAAGKRTANFVQAEVLRHTRTEGLEAALPVPASELASLLALVAAGTISGKMAKDVFAEMVATGRKASKIVEKRGLSQLSERGPIEAAVQAVLAQSPDNVAAYRAGKTAVLGWFVGQVLKATGGSANPKLVHEALCAALGEGGGA